MNLKTAVDQAVECLRQLDAAPATEPPAGVDLTSAVLHELVAAASKQLDLEPQPGAPYVEGQIVIDGRATQFLLMGDTASVQYTQWGDSMLVHGERQPYVAAMRDALVAEGFYYDTDEDEEAGR